MDDAAAVGDEPDHEDRALVGLAEPPRDVGDRLLEDPPAAAARPRRGLVDIYGERLLQRHVQVDPAKLAPHGVSLDRVMKSTADAVDAGVLQFTASSTVGTGGFVETNGQRMNIRHVQPIVGPKELANVPVAVRDGRTLRLADMGRVVEANLPAWGEAVINDGSGLMLIVQKFRGANTMEVTHGVEAAVDDLRPGLPGMAIDTTIFRPATFIEQSIDNLSSALLIGVALVILIIAAFLFEWRTAFISLVAIPLSLVAAILVLDLRGTTINVMVLAGLVVAIGVVVDDAIIDVENIVRRLRQARLEGREVSTFRIVLDASVEVRSAITYATIINVVAIVPVFFLQGLSGSFFQPLVLSYALAVLVSMLVALTVTPALCLLMLSAGAWSPASRRCCACSSAATGRARGAAAPAGPRLRRGGRAVGGRRADLPDARLAAAAELQGARLPDALAHRAVDVGARGEAHLDPRLPRPPRDPRRAQLRLAHRPGAALGRDLRRLLRRELDQRRRGGRLRQDARLRAPHGRGLPRPVPRRADLSARADQGGPDRDERVDRRADIGARARRPARARRTRSPSGSRTSRASSTRTPTSPRTCRTSRSR